MCAFDCGGMLSVVSKQSDFHAIMFNKSFNAIPSDLNYN